MLKIEERKFSDTLLLSDNERAHLACALFMNNTVLMTEIYVSFLYPVNTYMCIYCICKEQPWMPRVFRELYIKKNVHVNLGFVQVEI